MDQRAGELHHLGEIWEAGPMESYRSWAEPQMKLGKPKLEGAAAVQKN